VFIVIFNDKTYQFARKINQFAHWLEINNLFIYSEFRG